MSVSKRQLPCECCGQGVVIRDRTRFLQLVRSRLQPLCEQCRRYVSPGIVRETQPGGTADDWDLQLVAKRGVSAKRTGPLASRRLKRVGIRS